MHSHFACLRCTTLDYAVLRRLKRRSPSRRRELSRQKLTNIAEQRSRRYEQPSRQSNWIIETESTEGLHQEDKHVEKRESQKARTKIDRPPSSTAHSKEAVHPSTTVTERVFCTTRRRRRHSTFLRESTGSQRKRFGKDKRGDVQEGQSSDVDSPYPDDVHLLDRAIVNDLEAQDDAVKLASKGSQ